MTMTLAVWSISRELEKTIKEESHQQEKLGRKHAYKGFCEIALLTKWVIILIEQIDKTMNILDM